MLFFFILGNNPTLSIAEISQVFANRARITQISSEVLLLETKEKIDCDKYQRQLGGTVKIGEIVEARPSQILKLLPQQGKVYFGFSLYKLDDSVSLKKFAPELKRLGMETKRALQKKGLKARWVVGRDRILSSVVVKKNKLLEGGAEIVFLVGKQRVYLGKTKTVQEFEEYGWRDWQRPQKRIKAGMIPPKLAKMMINLALSAKDSTILDPFCGSGTILQEAALLGFKNIIGADINNEAVEATKANLKWLSQKLSESRPPIVVFQCDARELSKKLRPSSIDAIVTEPYLGPTRILNYKLQIPKIIQEISDLYLSAFQEFKKILKKDGRVVIIFPVFNVGHMVSNIPILDEIKKMGYKVEIPISEGLRKHPVIKITPRGSIIYSRPDQRVSREVFVFKN